MGGQTNNPTLHKDGCLATEEEVQLGSWTQRYELLLNKLGASVNLPDEGGFYKYWAAALLELIKCDMSCVRLVTTTGTSFVCRASSVPEGSPNVTVHSCLSSEIGRMPMLMKEHRPILIDFNNPHMDDIVMDEDNCQGYMSAVSVPIVYGDEILGIYSALYRQPPWWNEEDVDYLCKVGRVLGVEFKRETSKRNLVEMRVLEEGKRLCSEIHDNLAQSMNVARLETERAVMTLEDGDTTKLAHDLKRIEAVCQHASDLIRNELLALRVAVSPSEKLIKDLRLSVQRFQETWGIDVDFRVGNLPEDIEVSKKMKVQMFRILNESLSNIFRHACANRVSVSIDGDDAFLFMRISDNGCGFDINNVSSECQGIKIMRERADLLGGKLIVQSTIDEGTTVCAVAPRLA